MANFNEIWISLIAHFKVFVAQYLNDVIEKHNISYVSYNKTESRLMYLMIYIRLNFALAINKLKRYMTNLGKNAMQSGEMDSEVLEEYEIFWFIV